MKAMTATPPKKAGRARNGSARRKAAARPKPPLGYDSPEFTAHLIGRFHEGRRKAIAQARKAGLL